MGEIKKLPERDGEIYILAHFIIRNGQLCQSVHKGYTNLRHLKQNKLQTSNIEHPKSSKILQTVQAKRTEQSVELICNILKVFMGKPIKNICEDKKSRQKPPSAIRLYSLCCSVVLKGRRWRTLHEISFNSESESVWKLGWKTTIKLLSRSHYFCISKTKTNKRTPN